MQTHPDEHFEHSWQHSFVQLKSRFPLRVLLPIRMTWGIPKELWIQKRPTIIALQYSTYSLLFFMTGKHWDQSKELSKNCSSNFKWLGVIWGLDWLRQICSHCSWFEHELAVLIILFINLGERVSEWVSARALGSQTKLRIGARLHLRVLSCWNQPAGVPVSPLYLLLPLMPQQPGWSPASAWMGTNASRYTVRAALFAYCVLSEMQQQWEHPRACRVIVMCFDKCQIFGLHSWVQKC